MHSVPLVDALGFLDDTRKVLQKKMEIPTAGMSGGASMVEYGSPNGRQGLPREEGARRDLCSWDDSGKITHAHFSSVDTSLPATRQGITLLPAERARLVGINN